MGNSKEDVWREIHKKDMKDEERVKKWLEKEGYKVTYWAERKRSNKPYDIKATKDSKKWIVEVKGGSRPPIRLSNFRKMLTEKNVDMVGLALVIDRHPYLLSFNKHVHSADLAWITRTRRKAANRAWKTRRNRRA